MRIPFEFDLAACSVEVYRRFFGAFYASRLSSRSYVGYDDILFLHRLANKYGFVALERKTGRAIARALRDSNIHTVIAYCCSNGDARIQTACFQWLKAWFLPLGLDRGATDLAWIPAKWRAYLFQRPLDVMPGPGFDSNLAVAPNERWIDSIFTFDCLAKLGAAGRKMTEQPLLMGGVFWEVRLGFSVHKARPYLIVSARSYVAGPFQGGARIPFRLDMTVIGRLGSYTRNYQMSAVTNGYAACLDNCILAPSDDLFTLSATGGKLLVARLHISVGSGGAGAAKAWT